MKLHRQPEESVEEFETRTICIVCERQLAAKLDGATQRQADKNARPKFGERR